MKKGLVMEGGAMRGMFTAGVMDVLMTHHIEFDSAVGVSAGAAFGCNLKSKQIGRVIRYNTNHVYDKRFCSVLSLFTTGDLYGGKYCYETLPSVLDRFDTETFAQNPMEFWCVCTNAKTGNPIYHRCTDGLEEDLQYIRASASMPLVSRPVKAGGMKLLDGGMSDSIPLKWYEQKGFDKIVLILTQPSEYRKKPMNKAMLAGLKTGLAAYPALYEVMAHRHEVYNETVEYILEQEREGKVFVLRPEEPLNIGAICHNPDELQRVYRHGISVAEKQLTALKKYLEEN